MLKKSNYILKIYFFKPDGSRLPQKKPAYKVECNNSKIIDELYEIIKTKGFIKFYNIIFDSSRFYSAELCEN